MFIWAFRSPCICSLFTSPLIKVTFSNKPLPAKFADSSMFNQRYFEEKGTQIECIKLNGAIDIAPILGIAEISDNYSSCGLFLSLNALFYSIILLLVEIYSKYVTIHSISKNITINEAISHGGDKNGCHAGSRC